MSEKNLNGQINMFDILEPTVVKPKRLGRHKSEVEDKPEKVEEPEVIEESTTVEPTEEVEETASVSVAASDVVMHRALTDSMGREVKSVSYINYNKVKIVTNYEDEKMYTFETSKEAVDFYIEKMQNLKKL